MDQRPLTWSVLCDSGWRNVPDRGLACVLPTRTVQPEGLGPVARQPVFSLVPPLFSLLL